MNQETTLVQAIKIEQFAGPFHVLVELLEKQKLDITEVSLSTVCEQYLSAVNGQGTADPYALADFLVVAARLLYLKSKLLLPMLDWAEQEEELNLEERLKIFKAYYDAARLIEARLRERHVMLCRERLAVDVEVLFNPPHNLDAVKLKQVMQKIIKEIEPIVRVPKKIWRQVVSIREKISQVRTLIMERVTANFSELMRGGDNKAETIITFLAVLELVKQRFILTDQTELYGEISIQKIANNEQL